MKTNQELYNELQVARFVAACLTSVYKKPSKYVRQLVLELETELKYRLRSDA